MDELHVLLIPPRGSVSLLGGATSSSMIRGDLETECLIEELDGVKKLVAIFHIVVALTHNECTGGFLPVGKTHKRSIWRVEFIMVNYLYYCCWRVVSEVHKLGCILAP
jgi:hypothetical protein